MSVSSTQTSRWSTDHESNEPSRSSPERHPNAQNAFGHDRQVAPQFRIIASIHEQISQWAERDLGLKPLP